MSKAHLFKDMLNDGIVQSTEVVAKKRIPIPMTVFRQPVGRELELHTLAE